MIIAYHAIFTTYGTWLPNDPRGSFSVRVYNEELRKLREISYGRQDPQPPLSELRLFWTQAEPLLNRPPFFLDDRTRPIVAEAFDKVVGRLGLFVTACSVMNDHVHIVIMPSDYRIEYLMGQLKGAATHAVGLKETPWTRKGWKVFIFDQETLRAANHYVENNPIIARMQPQRWNFVKPLPLL